MKTPHYNVTSKFVRRMESPSWGRVTGLMVVVLFLLSACSGSGTKASGQSANVEKKTIPCYTEPAIPGMIVGEYERGIYFITHYWDNYLFEDTTCLHEGDLEQVFVDFAVPLKYLDKELATEIVKDNLKKASVSDVTFDWFVTMYEKYLYDAGSPVRHEETYAIVVESILGMEGLDEMKKLRPQLLLEEINKNREGSVATDFTYTLPNGSKQQMHAVAAPYTLLFFYDPDCSICKMEKEKLKRSPIYLNLLSAGKMKVLAISVGSELDHWKENLKDFPAEWLNGYDTGHTITSDELYVIKATPSMYLLDKGKRVILKDVMAAQIEEWLYENVTP